MSTSMTIKITITSDSDPDPSVRCVSPPSNLFFNKLADQNQDHIGSISISRKDGLNVCQSEMGRGRQAERHSEVERKGRVEAKVRQRTIIDIAQYLTRE